jgi:hypothetical protein
MTERTANDYLATQAAAHKAECARFAAVLGTSTAKRAQRKPRSLFARLFGI